MDSLALSLEYSRELIGKPKQLCVDADTGEVYMAVEDEFSTSLYQQGVELASDLPLGLVGMQFLVDNRQLCLAFNNELVLFSLDNRMVKRFM